MRIAVLPGLEVFFLPLHSPIVEETDSHNSQTTSRLVCSNPAFHRHRHELETKTHQQRGRSQQPTDADTGFGKGSGLRRDVRR